MRKSVSIQMLKHPVAVGLISMLLTACSSIQPLPDNKPVRLIFYNELNLVATKSQDCQYLGPIIGSAGHWYSYLFIGNDELTRGAINDIINKSNRIGANIVYVNNNIDFTTSVTLLGQAYHCNFDTSD